jgi:hypothetical protein
LMLPDHRFAFRIHFDAALIAELNICSSLNSRFLRLRLPG